MIKRIIKHTNETRVLSMWGCGLNASLESLLILLSTALTKCQAQF